MNIIDCKEVRNQMLEEAKTKLDEFYHGENVKLKLVVIQVEGDAASDVYIRNKLKTCEQVGIECEHVKLPHDSDMFDVMGSILYHSVQPETTGIMLQLPLPDHLKPYQQKLLDAIPWQMDVDGLSSASVGRLWTNQPCIAPATAKGVMKLLPEDLSGKDVCIVGRSNLVGKPLIKLLEERNATVTLCHSRTQHLAYYTERANIIVSAIGKPKYFDSSYAFYDYDAVFGELFPDDQQTWIDVGINRDENGKLCGDIDIETFKDIDCNITPVPGGVGLLTTAQLVLNVIDAYYLRH